MLLACDAGFANFGWAVMEKGIVRNVGVIVTSKCKKKSVRVSDDYATRSAKIASSLQDIILMYGVDGIIGELPSGGAQSAKAACMMSISTAIVSSVAAIYELPTEWCTPGDVKKAVAGRLSAPKHEIMDRIAESYGWKVEKKGNRVTYFPCDQKYPKGTFEHVADAIGAYWALKDVGNLVKIFG